MERTGANSYTLTYTADTSGSNWVMLVVRRFQNPSDSCSGTTGFANQISYGDGDTVKTQASQITGNTGKDICVRSYALVGTFPDSYHAVGPLSYAGPTLTLNSAGADNKYVTGDHIEVTAAFGYNVDVSGTPRIGLTIGSNTRYATYNSGTGTANLVFRYTVVAADLDTDGVSIAANALALNSGTIQDSGDTNAVITHSALAASANHKVNPPADTAPSFGSSTIANQSLTQNSAMTSLTLPAATGGNGTLSYSLSPALPAGLTFTASTRVLSGTPTGTKASTTYTYTVSDGDNNTADTDKDTLTFTIVVAAEDTAPSFADNASIANQSLTQNSAMTDLTLPAATGGNGTLSYSISPSLPAGLSFTASTRVLSGTPTGTSASATYTYTVTDADDNTASTDKDTLTFTIVVAAEPDTAPAFADNASIANQSLTQNTAISDLTLPAATGGNGTLSYSLSPALPAGLTFTASTRVLSGTPSASAASATYTYTVSDGDNNTASTDKDTLTFTIVVAADSNVGAPGKPTGFTVAPVKQAVELKASVTGSNISKWQYRHKRSGQDDSRYSSWKDFPSSASNTLDKQVATGSGVQDLRTTRTYVFQVRAVNSSGDGQTSDASTAVSPLSNDHIYVLGMTTVSITAGGNISRKQVQLGEPLTGTETVTLVFSVANNSTLVSVDADPDTSGVRVGQKGHQNEMTFTASNWNRNQAFDLISNLDTAGTATVNITVKTGSKSSYIGKTASLTVNVAAGSGTDTVPRFSSNASIANQSLTQNSAMTDLTLPSALAGNGSTGYGITPTLPLGLSFNALTRVLSGTPTTTQAATSYTYTAWDGDNNTADSDEDTLTFTIEVAASGSNTAPTVATAIADQTVTVGGTTTVNIGSTFSDADNDTLTYTQSSSDTAKATVARSGTTLTISGVAAGLATITVTASDGTDSVSDTFTVTVSTSSNNAPTVSTAIADQTVTVGGTTTVNIGSTFSDADKDTLTYTQSSSDTAKATVSRSGTTLTISGVAAGSATITVTASDGTDSVSDMFTVTVTESDNGEPPPTPVTPPADTPPAFASNASIANLSLTQGEAMTAVVLPAAAVGIGTLSYAIMPTLPPGLTFNPATRTLSGTPTGTLTATTYTYTVTGTASDTATLRFTITVQAADTAPAFGAGVSIADLRLTQGQALTARVLPAATGGDGALRYSFSPTLPPGLSFDPATRTLSGTPTGTQSATTYTYTVADADANTGASDTATLRFRIAVQSAHSAAIRAATQAWASRFGRTIGTHITDAVNTRLREDGAWDSHLTVAGWRIPLDSREPQADTSRQASGTRPTTPPAPNQEEPDSRLTPTRTKPATATDSDQGTRLLTGLAGLLGLNGPTGGTQNGPVGGTLNETPWLNGPPRQQNTGQALNLPDLRQALIGSAFRLNLNQDAGGTIPQLTAWGRVAHTQFNGQQGRVALDGDVLTGTVGVDTQGDRWLAGIAVSHSRGDGGYTDPAQNGLGNLDTTLTSLQPYLRYALTDRLTVWGLLGYGWGDLSLTPPGETAIDTDTDFLMGAVGSRGLLLDPATTGGFQLATRLDAMFTRTSTDDLPILDGTDADAHRLRVMLEGSRRFAWAEGRVLTPTVEVGLRHDWGDAETGMGIEVGGRVQYADPTLGLTVEGAVRGLVAHEDEAYDEWGASGMVRLAPGVNGQGLALTLQPAWGAATASGVEALWGRQSTAGLAPRANQVATGSLAAEVGYGMALYETGLVTPYAGTMLAEGAGRTYRVGTRLLVPGQGATGLTMTLEGLRTEPTGLQPLNQGFRLQATWGF